MKIVKNISKNNSNILLFITIGIYIINFNRYLKIIKKLYRILKFIYNY